MTHVRCRLLVFNPPPDTPFAVQEGSAGLVGATPRKDDRLQFDFELRIGLREDGSGYQFLGPFAQGTPRDRFVYLNSGRRAGQSGTPWDRRAKIKLLPIPAELLKCVLAKPGLVLCGTLDGTGRDGGPICASIAPDKVTWTVEKS